MRNFPLAFGTILLFATILISSKANAQAINGYEIYHYCQTDSMYVRVAGCAPTDSIETFYGDGTSDFHPIFFCSGDSYTKMYGHYYSAMGVYTIKFVHFSGGIPVDSVIVSKGDTISCREIRAYVYNDVNWNCRYDAGDFSIHSGVTVEIDSAEMPIDTITSTYGFSKIVSGPNGTIYSFKILNSLLGFNVGCPVSGIVYDTLGITTTTPSIGFVCDPMDSFDLTVSANFSVGLNGAGSHIDVHASSCASIPIAATLRIDYSPKYAFSALYTATGGATYPYTVSGNSVTFDLGNVSANSPAFFIPGFNPTGPLVLGDTANAKFTLTPTIGDVNIANNIIITCDTIHLSHDPNYKSVMPTGNITPGTLLKYSISFENTGNDTAFNIHVMDTLSDDLDIHTFKAISASAPMNLIFLKSGGHNIVKFDFPNINLLDTSHHHYCDGMVTYTIQAKTSLTPGTRIDNKAGIYFDVNPVVMTNNVENIIAGPAGLSIASDVSPVAIYPNPATDLLTVSAITENTAYRILSMTGVCLYHGILTPTNYTLSVGGCSPGVYILETTSGNGKRNIVRVVKE